MFSRAPISKLCCDVLLLSGAAIPAGRYRSILRDSPAGLIPCAEGELGLGVPLLSRYIRQPPCAVSVISCHTGLFLLGLHAREWL